MAEEKGQEEAWHGSSFSGCHTYIKALYELPRRLKERAGATWTVDEEMLEIRQRSGAEMKRKLEWYDLVALGVGGMLGSGVFVATGQVAHETAGPAVVLAYVVAGVSALLSAFCYTEFAVEMPVAGGAFSYLRVTLGEFAGYIAGANLILEYVLSNASVARSFTQYFSSIFGVDNDGNPWRIHVVGLPNGYNNLDLVALILVVALTIFICRGTKESSVLNLAITVLHLVLFAFIIVAGFTKGKASNLTRPANPMENPAGFFPYGTVGVFNGAAIVYFSYIGYDSVSTMAEEIKKPTRSLPLGVSGSVVIVSLVYCLMSLALCLMVPYDKIDSKAAFTEAFKGIAGCEWAATLVGVGASLGILASLIVAMLGQARYLCVIGRARLIPYFFARVHPRIGTPLNATALLGLCTAAIALFTDVKILLDMMCIGILLVFYMVANALIHRRYIKPGVTSTSAPTLVFLLILSAASTGFSLFWNLQKQQYHPWGLLACGATAVLSTAAFQYRVPMAHRPKDWGVPLVPWLPAASVFLNVFLLSTLSKSSYLRFGVWTAIAVAYYLLYSLHSSHDVNHIQLDKQTQHSPTTPPPHHHLLHPVLIEPGMEHVLLPQPKKQLPHPDPEPDATTAANNC